MAGLPTGAFENAKAIYQGLLKMGLSTFAAAGVAGNIYQESHGNPHSSSGAGGGLFGETLANKGSVHGGSLDQQLGALKAYINANGSIGDINKHASSPRAAALYFSEKYERPGIPNNPVREAAAEWVAGAAKSGNWGTSKGSSGGGGGGSGGGFSFVDTLINPLAPFLGGFKAVSGTATGVADVGSAIGSFADELHTLLNWVSWLFQPANWVRLVAGAGGFFFLVIGGIMMFTAAK